MAALLEPYSDDHYFHSTLMTFIVLASMLLAVNTMSRDGYGERPDGHRSAQ